MDQLPDYNLDPPECDASFVCMCCMWYNDVVLASWKPPIGYKYICENCGHDQENDADDYRQEWQDRLKEEEDDASFAAGEEEHRGGGER
jgi:hypothetical protein